MELKYPKGWNDAPADQPAECTWCGEKFDPDLELDGGFCSDECKAEHEEDKTPVACLECGDKKNREDMWFSETGAGPYCGKWCFKAHSYENNGEGI